MNRKLHTGFTLIELMISIGVIGLLASVAFASFRIYTIQAKASEAALLITNIVNAEMSFWYQEHLTGAGESRHCYLLAPFTGCPSGSPGPTKRDWDDTCTVAGSFTEMGFRPSGPVYFSYSVNLISSTYASGSGTGLSYGICSSTSWGGNGLNIPWSGATALAVMAKGDLNGDGVQSLYFRQLFQQNDVPSAGALVTVNPYE